MSPFRYENNTDPRYAATIGDLMLRGPAARAAAAERIGAIQAQGANQVAGAYAGAAQNIGQIVGAIPGQIQRLKSAGLQNEIDTLHLRGAAQTADDDQRLRAAYQQSGGDPAQMRKILAGSGGLTLQHDQMLQQMSKAQQDQHDEAIGEIGYRLHQAGNTPDAVKAVMTDAVSSGAIPAADAQKYYLMSVEQPDKIKDVSRALMSQSKAFRPELDKTFTVKKGEEVRSAFDPEKVLAKSEPVDTEVELAKRAATGDPLAIDAMNRLKPAPNRTTEQDDQRYRDIIAKKELKQPISATDAAWATGYEHQKTLGVDTTASAASTRQANAIAAQTAQQARAQGFTEAQAGRKELTEKVETPYRQAQQSAQELRDLVHAAQAGNKEAASLQALQATMSTVRANGLNRLNQAEMKLPEGAGSVWDRAMGKIGKLVSGQPIDASLQKDLLELSDLMEKGAYNRYATSHKDITTRYKLTDEKPAAPPAGYFSAVASDGKTYVFSSQEKLDAFKKDAGIK